MLRQGRPHAQVFVNLLSNAIKCNRAGGSVQVGCSVGASGRKRIDFRDAGSCLSAEKLSQPFQLFNRLGQESGAEEGSGIGLIVSKRLVELMGGQIGAQSGVGVGSVFWVELESAGALAMPFDVADATMQTIAMARGENASSTVLCVEDDPANMMMMEKLIARRPDIRMLSASDGHQASRWRERRCRT